MPRGDHFARQWRLLQLLGQPAGLAVEEAARELGCAVRTVWRDLRALQDAGLPIYDERDGRHGVWKVERGFHERLPLPLSLPEVVALLVSRDLLDSGGAGPFAPAISSAFDKIRALLTPRALELVERMRRSVGARTVGAKLQLGTGPHLATIHRALAEGRTLQMRYYSLSRDAETERRVDPYQLTFFNGGLYLVGHCDLRGEARVFAAERIRAVTALRDTFVKPADFDAEAYLLGAWGIVRGDLVAVRAVFSRAAAPHVRDRLWHASQELRELPGGRLELRLTVADTLEVRRWLMGFGADVEVLAPPALREAIRREAERLALALARKPPVRIGAVPGRAPRRVPAARARQARPVSASLALARYRVTLEALEPLDLPAYLGSTLRGAFGRAFRRLCCLGRDGEACPVPESCAYHLVFETAPPPGADALRTHDEIPRPFVIAPPPAGSAEHPAGSEVCFDLTLVGRARRFLPHFVVTLREVDRLGRGRRAVALRRIDAIHPLSGSGEVVYTSEESLVRPREATVTLEDCAAAARPDGPMRVTFLTQTRLKHDGAFARRPEFQVLFRRLLGRLSALARFHGDGPLAVDFRGLIDAAGHAKLVSDETRPTRWARYSARQDRRMQWEGLEGNVVYEGDLAPFWPYLVFGQWTHVGSGATFGLGGYRIER